MGEDAISIQPDSLDRRAVPPSSKARQLRSMIYAPGLDFLMEAHDGLSAKIVEGSHFNGIWASGLSMSAALGVRDNNEASWTQILDVLEFMSDATSIPILVDGDTGYGNFNNVRRLVRKLCQRNIAGICIEDKLFPKTNSFIGSNQPLADIDEFCGRIKAGKDSQTDPDFCVAARVEAFIAGWGLDEALKRAEAYHHAGADAILIHSKQRVPDEILSFATEWGDRCPLIIVPTTYYDTPTDVFRKAGISVVIWANHTLRAAITAMQEVTRQIRRDEGLAQVEPTIVSVQEVFKLAGNAELAEAETRYLPTKKEQQVILLAASRGEALGKLTEDRPKCMLDIRGKPLLRRLVAGFQSAGIRDVTVVRGYRKEMINLPSINVVDNDQYASTGEAMSLACAKSRIYGDCVIAYGDILLRQYVLERILSNEGDIVLGVDALWQERESIADCWTRDLVSCTGPFSVDYLDDEQVYVRRVSHHMPDEEVDGEWIGVVKLSPRGSEWVRTCLERLQSEGRLQHAGMFDVFSALIESGHPLHVVYVTGHWLDVDDNYDLQRAREFP